MKNNMYKWLTVLAVVTIAMPLTSSCGDDEPTINLFADFSYEFIDDNNVRFVNLSEGEYYSLNWDFGNNETASNTNKTKTYEIYYPNAGTYAAKLTIVDFDGNSEGQQKEIVISENDLVVSFTITPDAANPNKIVLVNTTEGEYDSFKWMFKEKVVENETNTTAYFPYKGDYEIELQISKNELIYSEKQTINISEDDPDYISSFELTWAEEFDGNEVNLSHWTFEIGSHGWGNDELQNYTDGNNVKVQDGILIITAEKINDDKVAGSYTSTRMITSGKKEFRYGRMEISAKLPSGTGIWPAIWMLGADIGSVGWPACGEIDIMEYVGFEPNIVHATVHTPSGYGANGNGSSKILTTAEEEFHIYGIIWTEKEIVFYTDSPENVTHTYSPANKTDENWPFDKPHFFILNIAVGGSWGGAQGIDNSIFPQTIEVDYVRVYQPLN